MSNFRSIQPYKKPDRLRQYTNLIRFVKNWPAYVTRKWSHSKIERITFHTRRSGVSLVVPRALLAVFREVFMEDIYAVDRLAASLPVGATIVDIGANAGLFSLLMLSRRSDARIVAFEPFPANFSMLKANAEMNADVPGGIEPCQYAVLGSPHATATLFFDSGKEFTPTASLVEPKDGDAVDKVTVRGITFQESLEALNISSLDLLKVDCEGGEFDLFYNTPDECFEIVGQMVIEVHESEAEGHDLGRLHARIESLGFRCMVSSAGGRRFMLRAVRS